MDLRGEAAGRHPDDYLSSVGMVRINISRASSVCVQRAELVGGLLETPGAYRQRELTWKEKGKGSAKQRLKGKHNRRAIDGYAKTQ